MPGLKFNLILNQILISQFIKFPPRKSVKFAIVLDSCSDMGSLYHIDIVEAIADCERTLRILRLLFDQIDGTCLLPGSGSEDYHRFGLHQDILCKGFQ